MRLAWLQFAVYRILRQGRHLARSREALLSLALILACTALLYLPTGFEERIPQGIVNAHGTVLDVNNSRVRQFGLVRDGNQYLKIRIADGPFKNQVIDATNILMGKLELDAFFREGDRAFLNLAVQDGTITSARAVDHYRIDMEIILFALFAILLITLGFWSGLRALLSFVFTGLALWKITIPLFLKGYNPIISGAVTSALMMAAILFLVGGLNRRGIAAFIGSMLGLGVACGLAIGFKPFFMLNGAVRPFSETLLYSGFAHLNLSDIFIAGIFIASSGAMMDLAIDLSSATRELAHHRPDLGRWKLFLSGMNIGRAVTGTMTTTLLLAYSGGYLTMLMLFMGQGIPLANILNMNYVSSEIFHTIIGSIALVATAPLTAGVGAFLFGKKTPVPVEGRHHKPDQEDSLIPASSPSSLLPTSETEKRLFSPDRP